MQFCFPCALKTGHAREEGVYGDHHVHTLDLAKETSGCRTCLSLCTPFTSTLFLLLPRKQESSYGYMIAISQDLMHVLAWLE